MFFLPIFALPYFMAGNRILAKCQNFNFNRKETDSTEKKKKTTLDCADLILKRHLFDHTNVYGPVKLTGWRAGWQSHWAPTLLIKATIAK